MTQTTVGQSEVFPFAPRFLKESPEQACLLLVGESGVGKSAFGQHALSHALIVGGKAIALLTSVSTEAWLAGARSLALDLEPAMRRGQLTVIDVYSALTGGHSTSPFGLKEGASLADVSIAVSQATRGERGFDFLFDDLPGILAYVESASAYKFTQILVSRLREAKARALCLLQPGVLDANLERLLLSVFDGQLQMKLEETAEGLRRYFRVRTMRGTVHSTAWTEMRVGPGGIAFARPVLPNEMGLSAN